MQGARSYSVNYSKVGAFTKRYPALAHLPFILDSRPRFHRLGNAYLVAKGLGLWDSANRGSAPADRIPSKRSMNNYAHWLANFLEWADRRRVSLATCDYATQVAGRYQEDMLQGLWSRTGDALSATTVNLRVQQACEFLTWMGDNGHREAFRVPYSVGRLKIGSATSSIGHLAKEVRVRKGKVKQKRHALRMPANAEVKDWLQRVLSKSGATLALMCETVLRTAMRREEVACLRVDTLPEQRSMWHIANPLAPPGDQQVRININFGTKGPSYREDHGDKVGPSRDILIPLSLAIQWDDYRRGARNAAFAAWMKGVKGAARQARARESVHLFLRDSDGARVKAAELYSAWTGVELPVEGWSPHKGRHWWACSVLWRELQKHQAIAHLSSETAAALLESTAQSIIRMHLQPQLGHADDSTTMLYVTWVKDMIGVPVSLDDERDYDDEDEDEEA